MGVSWTLCIELSFYLLLPLLSLGLAQMARRWSSAAARAAVAALPLLCALPLSWAFVAQVGTAQPMHLWLPAFIDEFAIGMLLAIALEFRPHVSLTQSRVLLAVAVLVAVTANVYCFDVGPLAPYGNGSSMLFGRLMTVAFALALGSVLARQEGTVLGRFRSSRTLTLAGTISYGIYLWHPFVIDELRRTPLWQNAWGNVPMVMVGAIVCATASWLLVERPALRLKDRQWRPEAPPATEHPIAAVEAVNT